MSNKPNAAAGYYPSLRPIRLTSRQRSILDCFTSGSTTHKEIGRRLGISEHTVRAVISGKYANGNIYERLGIGLRAERAFAVVLYLGWLSLRQRGLPWA